MKFSLPNRNNTVFIVAITVALLVMGCPPKPTNPKIRSAVSIGTDTVSNALPFTIQFVEQNYNTASPLPRLQSYRVAATPNGLWLVIGGRRQGLHTFEGPPATNFIRDSANHFIYVINPVNGQSWNIDVNTFSNKQLAAVLQASNQESYYDAASGMLYLVGGYGWKADGSNMTTFNTIVRINAIALEAAITAGKGPIIAQGLMSMSSIDKLAVNAGDLFMLGGRFYLVFGQNFIGQYRAFSNDTSGFTQQYTEQVKTFTLNPRTDTVSLLGYGATTSSDTDHPFHRRDGNIIMDIDPATGAQRIAAFGGVFKPGIIGPYTYPVYIYNPSQPTIDRNGQQKFSQYYCPVISIFDSAATSNIFHVFYGGIGHYYYSQTDSQHAVYDTATAQGRNDGFPFVEDVSVFQESSAGAYSEYILPTPITNNRLLGTAASFMLNPALATSNQLKGEGVISLNSIPPGGKVLIGYVYGGIEAQNPLPLEPNTGTFVSNSVFAVYLTNTSSAAIPASKGIESITKNEHINRN